MFCIARVLASLKTGLALLVHAAEFVIDDLAGDGHAVRGNAHRAHVRFLLVLDHALHAVHEGDSGDDVAVTGVGRGGLVPGDGAGRGLRGRSCRL